MDNHLIEIRQARHLGEYRPRLSFSDGVVKNVDLAGELWGPVFEPLREPGPLRASAGWSWNRHHHLAEWCGHGCWYAICQGQDGRQRDGL